MGLWSVAMVPFQLQHSGFPLPLKCASQLHHPHPVTFHKYVPTSAMPSPQPMHYLPTHSALNDEGVAQSPNVPMVRSPLHSLMKEFFQHPHSAPAYLIILQCTAPTLFPVRAHHHDHRALFPAPTTTAPPDHRRHLVIHSANISPRPTTCVM